MSKEQKKAAKKAKKEAEEKAAKEAEDGNDSDDSDGFKVKVREATPEPADIPLTCRDCNAEFAFTVGEQDFFKQKGFTNQPVRCGDCKKAKKARFEGQDGGGGYGDAAPSKCYNCGGSGHMSRECPEPKKAANCYNCGQDGHMSRECPEPPKPRVCYAFQKGQCKFADTCKFAHE